MPHYTKNRTIAEIPAVVRFFLIYSYVYILVCFVVCS
nr:MAG TPA: hypothetical protein [Caudoviricetes sp.]